MVSLRRRGAFLEVERKRGQAYQKEKMLKGEDIEEWQDVKGVEVERA